MKKIPALIALLIAAALLLTACGNSLEGEWKYVEGTGQAAAAFNALQAIGGTVTFSFRSGRMTVSGEADGKTQRLIDTKFTADGGRITLTPAEGTATEGQYTTDGSRLTLTLEGSILSLEKK